MCYEYYATNKKTENANSNLFFNILYSCQNVFFILVNKNTMSHQQTRKQKMQIIINTLKKHFDEGVEYEKIISLVCVEFGSARRYVRELITDMINVGLLIKSDGILYYVGDSPTN